MKINNVTVELFNDDAYKQIQYFLDNKITVNHIITDPPYNISKENNFDTMARPRAGVDFGEWDKGKFNLFNWIPLYSKILDKNGSMIIFCSYRFLSYIIDTLESEESGMEVKDVIIWQKTNPMPRNRDRRYVQDMEFAIWAVKKKSKWVFNRPEGVPYLRSLFNTSLVSGSERTIHPTQKSLQLMKSLIEIHTNLGEKILDPFMGSGTTGVASVLLGRSFYGIELCSEYFNIAKGRIERNELK